MKAIQGLECGELKIDVVPLLDERLRLDWTGRSVDREPGKLLGPLFSAALGSAAVSGGAIEMHFERLQHFNSSTITALIGFIRAARAAGVQVTLYFDPALKWQQLSFEALRVFERPDGWVRFRATPAAS